MCDQDTINELLEKIENIEDRLDALCDSIEDTVESAVCEAVEDSIQDAMGSCSPENTETVMYIISQDGKVLMPFGRAQAYRKKKGEDPYVISVSSGRESRSVGTYENKASALAEIKNIAAALRSGETVYQMK